MVKTKIRFKKMQSERHLAWQNRTQAGAIYSTVFVQHGVE
jgi:hypothetical protein